ncbi:hypothetical protein [Pseudalkalibacillus sp. SCS-8]|uniref:hypothetical protein n=1 Tax=Pseudalkalibacillus nanhaiensis TaxID=3115291 RepID=UPI0032D9C3DC
MYPVFFNRKELCRLPINELQAMKQIVIFWGLVWENRYNELKGHLNGQTVCVIGLSPKENLRLNQLLKHTDLTLSSKEGPADLTISLIEKKDPNLFLLVEADGYQFSYENKVGPYRSTKDWIFKMFHMNIPTNNMKIYWNPDRLEDLTEWLTYLVLQWGSGGSTQDISSIPPETYESLLRKVLTPINPHLSSFQLHTTWPEKPSLERPETEKKAPPFDPFKYMNNSNPTSKMDPFKQTNKKNETKIINPFYRK